MASSRSAMPAGTSPPSPFNSTALSFSPFDVGTLIRQQSPTPGPVGGVTTPQVGQQTPTMITFQQAVTYTANQVGNTALSSIMSQLISESISDAALRKTFSDNVGAFLLENFNLSTATGRGLFLSEATKVGPDFATGLVTSVGVDQIVNEMWGNSGSFTNELARQLTSVALQTAAGAAQGFATGGPEGALLGAVKGEAGAVIGEVIQIGQMWVQLNAQIGQMRANAKSLAQRYQQLAARAPNQTLKHAYLRAAAQAQAQENVSVTDFLF